MSRVAYARYTRIIHSRQCCNLLVNSIINRKHTLHSGRTLNIVQNLWMIRVPSRFLYPALYENFSLKADTSRSSGCRTNTSLK